MNDVYKDYWMEAICQGADEAGVSLTRTEAEIIANYAESAHEHYGYSFYDPGPNEYYDVLERQHDSRVKDLSLQHEEERNILNSRIENLQYEIRRLENIIINLWSER